MARSRVLLLGKDGQVGFDLARVLEPAAEVTALGREQADLASQASLEAAVRSARPDWIVNAAAYTAVDRAESEPEQAYAINAKAVEVLAREAARCGAGVIHYSTDYVFDGMKMGPYVETDSTHPLNVYGSSKRAGEEALLGSGVAYAILRTSWVYSARGRNFLRTILRLADERDELRIVNDQIGSPTWSRDLAMATAGVLRAVDYDPERLGEKRGIYHAASQGSTSWFGFARAAFEYLGERRARLTPITTAEYPTAARRPLNSTLNCTRLEESFGVRLPDWEASLARVLEELMPVSAGDAR